MTGDGWSAQAIREPEGIRRVLTHPAGSMLDSSPWDHLWLEGPPSRNPLRSTGEYDNVR